VASFHLDRIVGFHRCPTVVPRYFTVEELDGLARQRLDAVRGTPAEQHELGIVDEMASFYRRCGVQANGVPLGSEGAMVGWSPFPVEDIVENQTLHFADLLHDYQRQTRIRYWRKKLHLTDDSSEADVWWAMESMAFNMWSVLTGYSERFDHNVFQTFRKDGSPWPHEGPFEYIDNDRSQWHTYVLKYRFGVQPAHHLRDACIFPRTLSNRLLVLHQNQTEHFGLGQLILDAVSVYHTADLEKNGPFFTPSSVSVVNQNLEFLVGIIRQCIETFGVDRVLIAEPWEDRFSSQEAFASVYNEMHRKR